MTRYAPTLLLALLAPSLGAAQGVPNAPLPADMFVSGDYASGLARIRLPMNAEASEVVYANVDGLAITEGDIVIGRVDGRGAFRSNRPLDEDTDTGGGRGTVGRTTQPVTIRIPTGASVVSERYLWPGGVIPYEISSEVTRSTRAAIEHAIAQLGYDTNLVVRPRRRGEADFVRFIYHDGERGCFSAVGRLGGRQSIRLLRNNRCGVAAIMHELLHAAGLWHEQSRPDRGDYVKFVLANVIDSPINYTGNFKRHIEDGRSITPYDIGSIMHYGPRAWGKPDSTGGPMLTLPPVNPGAPYDVAGRSCLAPGIANPTHEDIQGMGRCLSHLDIEGINILYPRPINCGVGQALVVTTDHRIGRESVRRDCQPYSRLGLCEPNEDRVVVNDHRDGVDRTRSFCRDRYTPEGVCPVGQQEVPVRVRDNRTGETRYRTVCRVIRLGSRCGPNEIAVVRTDNRTDPPTRRRVCLPRGG